ncbi:MAG: peptidoglycan bridge formation glycyltransferase FemA/FemB family protein, partial [Patescibacteria group bacterium]
PSWPEDFVDTQRQLAALREQGWRKSEREVQPRHTLRVDLKHNGEEELLAAMHSKTRYNIRLAERRRVAVRFSQDVADVEHFLRLSRDVHERSQFSYHPDGYYRTILEVLGRRREGNILEEMDAQGAARAEVALAEYEGEILAAHIVISFKLVTTYAHGASSSKLRELMAPHLLQWETMKRAKAAGKFYYDFFGVAPEGADKDHPWSGITRFKLGFGGERVNYIGAYDLVLRPGMYHLFNAARRLRSFVR